MAASKGGGATIELTQQSKKNLDLQLAKLKEKGNASAMAMIVKLLFDIKYLAQNKLKSDRHIISSRLRNSIHVQLNTQYKAALAVYNRKSSGNNYADGDGKTYNAQLDVELSNNEGAVGTNVEYASAIELGSAPHEIVAKNYPVLGNKKVGFFGKKVQHPGFKGDSFLWWASKNVDVTKRVRETSAELLNGLK